MFSFENTIVINRPVKEVFDFLTDLTSIPKWNYYVRSVRPTSAHSGVAGATYHQVRRDDEQDLKISKLEPNRVLVVETIPPSTPELRREMLLEPDGQGTRVIDQWQLDMGVPKLLEPLAAQRAKSGVRDNLEKLKALLESGRVTLQDGRSVNR